MSEPFTVLGWALRWHWHTCAGNTTQNTNPPRYSTDYVTVRELIYDEWAEYCFHIRVRRTDPNYRLYIKGELVQEKGQNIFMSTSSPVENVNPKEPYLELSPAPDHSAENDTHTAMLFWPSGSKDRHAIGLTQKFRFTIGFKSISEANTIKPRFVEPMPLIYIFVTDVMKKEN